MLLLNPISCINKNGIITIDENKQAKSGKFKFLLQLKF